MMTPRQDHLAPSVPPENDLLRSLAQTATDNPSGMAGQAKRHGQWTSLTWGELHQRVASLGAGLAESGYGGRTVGLIGDDSIEWVEMYLALMACGSVVAPLALTTDTAQIRSWIERLRIEALACDSYSRLASIVDGFGTSPGPILEAMVWRPDRRVERSTGVRLMDGLRRTVDAGSLGSPPFYDELILQIDGSLQSPARQASFAAHVVALIDKSGSGSIVSLDSFGQAAARAAVLGGAVSTGRDFAILEPSGDLEIDLRQLRPAVIVVSARRFDAWADSVFTRLRAMSGLDRHLVHRWTRGLEGQRSCDLLSAAVSMRLRARLGLARCSVILTHSGPIRTRSMALLDALGVDRFSLNSIPEPAEE
jgi:long-subunit acyl-CoA synthetase (AMP-forming)